MELRDAVAVVTGGTGGLGQQICRAFARTGSHVAVIYQKSKDDAEALAGELSALGPRSMAFQSDVTDPGQTRDLAARVLEEFGRIDVLVNNAAYNQWVPFRDLDGMTLELWDYIMKMNTTGPFLCIKAVAPAMLRQKCGRIVNVASIAAFLPAGSSIAYAVSKAALVHLTRCMAVALGPEVTVNAVAPGTIEGTKMTARLDPAFVQEGLRLSALKRTVSRDDIADQIVTLARSDSITGEVVTIDAGRAYH